MPTLQNVIRVHDGLLAVRPELEELEEQAAVEQIERVEDIVFRVQNSIQMALPEGLQADLREVDTGQSERKMLFFMQR